MITSGLLLHICVGAMLIMKSHQEKNTTNTPENSNKENVTKNNDANKDDVHDNNNHSNSAKTMTLNLISNVLFILLLISSTIFLFGQSVVFTHIIAFAESLNLSQSVGSAMVSAIGVSALIGRVVLSMLSQLPWVDSTVLYIAAVTVCGKCYVFRNRQGKLYNACDNFISCRRAVCEHIAFTYLPVPDLKVLLKAVWTSAVGMLVCSCV